MLYDAKLSQIYAARMQEEGIYEMCIRDRGDTDYLTVAVAHLLHHVRHTVGYLSLIHI